MVYIITVLNLYSQKPNLHFSGININNQLNDNKIWSFVEDERGFMYFGGENGLYRYDGHRLKNFHHSSNTKSSISNDRAFSLLIDKENRFWVGTSSGLNIYDKDKNTFYNFLSPGTYTALKEANGHIESISQDQNGNIWFSDKEKGLGYIQSVSKPAQFFSYEHPDYNLEFFSTAITSDNKVWVGTNHGLYMFDPNAGKLKPIRTDDYEGFNILKLYASKEYLWIGTFDGLWRYDLKSKEFRHYKTNFSTEGSISEKMVSSIQPYGNGLLVGLDGGGIDYFDFGNEKFYNYNSRNEALLNCENITSLYIDRHGSIWAGTYMHGINISNISTNFSTIVKNKVFGSAFNCIITGFSEDSEGNLWVVTDRGGVFVKKRGSDEFGKFEVKIQGLELEKIAATDIEVIGKEIWMSTWGMGLLRIDEKLNIKSFTSDQQFVNSDKISSLYLDKYRNQLWVGYFGAGISVINLDDLSTSSLKHRKIDSTTIISDWVNEIYGDSYGNIWICTIDGLSRYIRNEDSFQNIQFKKGGSVNTKHNFLNDIIQYEDSLLLVASNGLGIVKVNLRRDFNYTFIDHFLKSGEQNVKTLLIDQQKKLWFCTPHTINKFEDFNSEKIIKYNTVDGLKDVTFNSGVKYIDGSGKLYLGTSNGFLMVDPTKYKPNTNIPPVYITEVIVLKRDSNTSSYDLGPYEQLSSSKAVNLNYDENDLTINFAALNYISPGNNRYKFRLEGAEERWHVTNTPTPASYYNLSPGKYRFVVRACNNDGVWNNEGATLYINIESPWWKSWWFISLAILISVLSVYILITFRIKTINTQKLLLEKVVQKRTMELQTVNSTLETLLYRTSHDIRGPVKSLIGLVEIGKEEFHDNEKYKIYLNHIMYLASKLDNIVNELALISSNSFAKEEEQIDFSSLINETISSLRSISGFDDFEITIEENTQGKFFSNKKIIYSIFHNLIQNAFKYRDTSKKFSYLNIHIYQDNNEVVITFNDNGVGIDKNVVAKVFDMFYRGSINSDGSGLGLFVVKSLVEKLGGEITVNSSIGIGSEFKIKLPIEI